MTATGDDNLATVVFNNNPNNFWSSTKKKGDSSQEEANNADQKQKGERHERWSSLEKSCGHAVRIVNAEVGFFPTKSSPDSPV